MYNRFMNKYYSFLFGALLLIIPSALSAQTLPPKKVQSTIQGTTTTSVTPIVKPLTIDTKEQSAPIALSTIVKLKAEPLSVRKQLVEVELRETILKLATISARTQNALDHIDQKKFDTKKAEKALTVAVSSLDQATLSMNTFIAIVVPEENSALKNTASLSRTSSLLKMSVEQTESHLRDARAALIQSLAALKLTISIKSDGVL